MTSFFGKKCKNEKYISQSKLKYMSTLRKKFKKKDLDCVGLYGKKIIFSVLIVNW